jgi:transcriptional regulator CtsR
MEVNMVEVTRFTEDLHFTTIEFISLGGRVKGEIMISRKEFRDNFNRLETFIAEEISKEVSK